jgi:hypothetical protein
VEVNSILQLYACVKLQHCTVACVLTRIKISICIKTSTTAVSSGSSPVNTTSLDSSNSCDSRLFQLWLALRKILKVVHQVGRSSYRHEGQSRHPRACYGHFGVARVAILRNKIVAAVDAVLYPIRQQPSLTEKQATEIICPTSFVGGRPWYTGSS